MLGGEGEASSPPGGRGAVPRPPACPSWLHRWPAHAGRGGDSSGECSWAGMGLPYHHHLGRFQKGKQLNRGCPPLPRKVLVPAPGAVLCGVTEGPQIRNQDPGGPVPPTPLQEGQGQREPCLKGGRPEDSGSQGCHSHPPAPPAQGQTPRSSARLARGQTPLSHLPVSGLGGSAGPGHQTEA